MHFSLTFSPQRSLPGGISLFNAGSAPIGRALHRRVTFDLRAELNANQLLFLYNDPAYTYLSYESNSLLQQIVTTRPSYPVAIAFAQQIASYTIPPDDNAILEGRYSQRLALAALTAQVDFEARSLLASDPVVAGQLADLAFRQMERVQQIFASPHIVGYVNDWSTRFQSGFLNSPGFANLRLELEQIFLDFPAFREFLQLNEEVVNLLPLFNDHPALQQVSSLVTSSMPTRQWRKLSPGTISSSRPRWIGSCSIAPTRPKWNAPMSG